MSLLDRIETDRDRFRESVVDAYQKRPRQWAVSIPVIPTRGVDERDSRRCEKEFEWSSSVVKCVTFNVIFF